MSAGGLVVEIQNAAGCTNLPSDERFREWAALAVGDRRGELTIRVVDPKESAALNLKYRGRSGPTNVLAFPIHAPEVPPTEMLPLGDVVICADVLEREAAEQDKPLDAHWAHLVIHGTLHLLGHDHETSRDARAMENRERALLAQLGLADPYREKKEKKGSD